MANKTTTPNPPASAVKTTVGDLEPGDQVWYPEGWLTVTETDGFGPMRIIDFDDSTATLPVPHIVTCYRKRRRRK